jgi:hypothetical protein
MSFHRESWTDSWSRCWGIGADITRELTLYYPSRRQVPGPLRAFIDFMRTQSDVLDAARLKKSVNEPIVSGPVGPTR